MSSGLNCLLPHPWLTCQNRMDLGVPLEPFFQPCNSHQNQFGLIISHGTTGHEPLLCDLISRSLTTGSSASFSIPTSDPTYQETTNVQSALVRKCLLIALQTSVNAYQTFFTPAIRGKESRFQLRLIDVAKWVQQFLAVSGDAVTSERPSILTQEFTDRLSDYIKSEVDQFLGESFSSAIHFTIVVDNLKCLLDLGMNTRQIERLLSEWRRPKIAAVRLLVGCHVGLALEDPTASEMEPAFVHYLELCRQLSDVVMEVRPLQTGYTTSLDGELSVLLKVHSSSGGSFNSPLMFHYRYDKRRVLCYPPGTSKLIT